MAEKPDRKTFEQYVREALDRDPTLAELYADTWREEEALHCSHCDGTGQVLWRSPEQAGGVGEECCCEWCHGSGLA